MIEQSILPVIADWKSFERFLKSEFTWCILMDFHINFMEELLQKLHQHHKKGIVHMDLIQGIQNDTYGTQYMCQKVHADGIISTKPKAIEAAKNNHTITILRAFLLDSRSLKRSALLANTIQPDYMEVLPGVIPHVVEMIRKYSDIPLIAGGLMYTKKDVDTALKAGMSAISTSLWKLCEKE